MLYIQHPYSTHFDLIWVLGYTLPHVSNIPTQKEKKSQDPRVFGAVQDKNRQKGDKSKAQKRAGQTHGLNFRLVMLKKINRADTKIVEKIFKEGKSFGFLNLTFKFLKNGGNIKKISVIVPKSVAKLAVKRNLLRRLGYKALEKHIASFPAGLQGVFVFKKHQNDVLTLENEIKAALAKIN